MTAVPALKATRPEPFLCLAVIGAGPPLGCNTRDVNSVERDVSILNKGLSGLEDCEMGVRRKVRQRMTLIFTGFGVSGS